MKKNHFFIIAILFIPYALLLWGTSTELVGFARGDTPETQWRIIKNIFYLITYSLFPGIWYLIIISLMKKRIWAHTASILYVLSFFSFVLFVMIYQNYAGVVPQLRVVANPQEITSVIRQVLIQFMGFKEWLIIALMPLSLHLLLENCRKKPAVIELDEQKDNWMDDLFLVTELERSSSDHPQKAVAIALQGATASPQTNPVQ